MININLVKGESNTPVEERTRLQKLQLTNFGDQNRNIQ